MVGAGSKAATWRLMSDRAEESLEQYVNIESSHNAVEGRGLLVASNPTCGGAAKRISKGLRLVHACLLILMYIGTMGRAFGHGRPVSAQHLANLIFRAPFSLSTAPPLAGW